MKYAEKKSFFGENKGCGYIISNSHSVWQNIFEYNKSFIDFLASEYNTLEMRKDLDSYDMFAEDEKTVVLSNKNNVKAESEPGESGIVKQLYIKRILTEEKVAIKKPEFKIGKERVKTDFTITSNSAISREHLTVITHNERYFVIDQNTTNGTFVDGVEITPYTEVEIFPETHLRLADEEFVFFFEEVNL